MAFERAPVEQRIVITRAKPGDARIASRLIRLAMGGVADFMFGFGGSTEATDIIGKLFAQDGNGFSYRFSRFAKTRNGDIVGIVLAYPCGKIIGSMATTARQLIPMLGALNSFRFLRNALLLSLSAFSPRQLNICRHDEYYISTLAVLPEFQGMGIGTMLLAYAEDEAKRAGFMRCSLGVDVENSRALRLYKHLGYKITETVKLRYFTQRIGSRGFFQMAKDIRY